MKSFKVQIFITLTAIWSVVWTYIGQSFLAHNQYNDADSSYFTYGGLIINNENGLYKTFWDMKPPGIFYQNAFLIKLFEIDFVAYAWVHGVLFLCCLLFLGIALSKHIGIFMSTSCIAFVAYYYNLSDYIDYGNRPEFTMCLLEMLSAGFVLLYFKNNNPIFLNLAASCSCLAFFFKPVGMASFLALMILFIIGLFSKKRKKSTIEILWISLGFSIPLALIMFSWNSFEPLNAAIITPLKMSATYGPTLYDAAQQALWKYGPLWGFIPLIFSIPIVFVNNFRDKKLNQTMLFLVLFFLTSLGGIIVQKRGSPHYFLQGVVPILLLSAYCFHSLLFYIKQYRLKKIIIITFVAIILFFSRFSFHKQIVYYNFLEASYIVQKNKYTTLQTWLNQYLQTEDNIYYWSHGYQPYILSNRKSPGLYSPCFLKYGDAGANLIIKDLDLVFKAQPKVVIELKDFQDGTFISGTNNKGQQKKCFNKYKEWLNSHYSKKTNAVDGFNIYIKN